MFALAYASRAVQSFDELALGELADRAASKNRQVNITGYLHYKAGVFFQYLEGHRSGVLELMDVIGRDQRHQIVNVVHIGELEARLFPDWQMRYLTEPELATVRMEDVLEGVLLTMTEKLYGEQLVRGTVMRLVRKLASLRGRLAPSA